MKRPRIVHPTFQNGKFFQNARIRQAIFHDRSLEHSTDYIASSDIAKRRASGF
jgi:hypothetical protein